MTTKEHLHSLVDSLDENQAEQALAYVGRLAQGYDVEELTEGDLVAIRQGIQDIHEGRSVTLQEYEQGMRA